MADEAPLDIDETIAQEWERIKAEAGTDDPELVAEPEKETEGRDELGRFAPKAKSDEPEQEAEQPEQTAEPTTRKEMPMSWRREVSEEWDKLPDRVKDEVLKREADVRKGFESYKQTAEVGKRFQEVVQPYMATIQSMGIQPEQAAQYLLAADHQLRYGSQAQKQATLQRLVQSYGIEMPTGQQETPQGLPVDPRIAELENRLARYEEQQTYAARMGEQQEELQALVAVADFAYEREPNGSLKIRGYDDTGSPVYQTKPGRENFEKLRPMMGALVQANPSLSLEEAYRSAEFAHPDTRQALLAQQQGQHRDEARKKAEEAKRAAAVNIRPRGVITPSAPAGSMDDTILANAQRLGLAS